MTAASITTRLSFGVLVVGLVLTLLASLVWSMTMGPVSIDSRMIMEVVFYKITGAGGTAAQTLLDHPRADIIWNIRLPRVLMAAIVGAGLALCGVVMQAVVRNPLANPYILGISSGAALGATLAIALGAFGWFGAYGLSVGAFLGAMLASVLVFAIAFIGQGGGNTVKLLLAGMAITAVFGAFTSFVIYIAPDSEGIRSITFWLMGGLTAASWRFLPIPTVCVIAGLVLFLTQLRALNALLLGDEAALTLGVNVTLLRKCYLLVVSLITGALVAVSGTIGFVGLIIPHIVRMIVGVDHRKVVLLSALLGAIFLVLCDILAKTLLARGEMPIGIITAMLGGPFFIWLLLTKSYGFGEN
ncbi:MAG: iron ABC transporter permease [Steroidobacteraceae bacterium]